MRKYMELDEKIRDAYFAAKGRNGSPRLAKDLQASGTAVSRTTVACHMKEMGLRSKLSRRFKVTTDASHNYTVAPNLLNREFNQNEPMKACVSDLTYTVIPAIRMAGQEQTFWIRNDISF